jgi:hypothetical protein
MSAATKTQQAFDPDVDTTNQQVAKKPKNQVAKKTGTATRSSARVAEQQQLQLQQREQQQVQAQRQRQRQIEEYEGTASAEASSCPDFSPSFLFFSPWRFSSNPFIKELRKQLP